jgi:hypothetical protein
MLMIFSVTVVVSFVNRIGTLPNWSGIQYYDLYSRAFGSSGGDITRLN